MEICTWTLLLDPSTEKTRPRLDDEDVVGLRCGRPFCLALYNTYEKRVLLAVMQDQELLTRSRDGIWVRAGKL